MRILQKTLVVIFLMSLGMETYAQSITLKGGANFSSMLLKDEFDTYSDDDAYKTKIGFHAGLSAEFPVSENIVFETGLLFASKGFAGKEEVNVSGNTIDYKQTLNLLYLDIPATAKIYVGEGNSKPFLNIGAYLGYGLSGKNTEEVTIGGETTIESIDVEWGNDDEEHFLKPLDFGLMAGAGVELNSIVINIFYQLGLANISTYTEDDSQIKNRVLGVSVGYKLGGK